MIQRKKLTFLFKFLLLMFMLPISLCSFTQSNKERRMSSDFVCLASYAKERLEKNITTHIDRLYDNFSLHSVAINTLSEMRSNVQLTKTLTQAEELFNYLNEPFIKRHKEIECGVALQAGALLGNYTNLVLLKLLVTIDDYLLYWQEMSDHPTYYFFHKSPLKWLTGKKQQQEIDENIRLLSALQQKYRKILGRLIKHVQQFNEQGTIEEQDAWLSQFVEIVRGLYIRQPIMGYDDSQLIQQMKCELRSASSYKNHEFYCLSQIKPSNHLVRNWLRYTALSIAISLAYKNKTCVQLLGKEAQQRYQKSIKRVWSQYFINPLRSVYDTIMTTKEPEKLQIADRLEEQERMIEHNRKLLEERQEEIKGYIEITRTRKEVALA